jgi:hypothetical protein
MPMPRAKILTPTVWKQIQVSVDRGLSASEIAEAVGCTLGTLRVNCSHMKISLRQRNCSDHVSTFSRNSAHKRKQASAGVKIRSGKIIDSRKSKNLLPDERSSNKSHHGAAFDKDRSSFSLLLPRITINQIQQQAALAGIRGMTLAARLLEIVARDNLYDAVLDERDEKERAQHVKTSRQ